MGFFNRLCWNMATRETLRRGRRKASLVRRVLRVVGAVVLAFYALVIAGVILLRWINPFTTAVQTQRRVETLAAAKPYKKTFKFVPMQQISPSLQHAVVAAEDSRFFQHHGFDWTEVRNAVEDKLDGVRTRGASTITQQLIKNLFLTTSPSIIRKGIEATIVPIAELMLPKRRILELYLNVIEWGPGIYGAEAAARYYYHIPANRLSREQAVELASVLPAPLRRKPGRVSQYAAIISARMSQMGW